MPKLPQWKPAEIARILERAGFELVHQKGSHAFYRKVDRFVTLPMHPKELAKGTLHMIVKRSGLPPDSFMKRGKGKDPGSG